MNLYVTTQGAYVKKSAETIIVEKDGEKIARHPVKDISTLVIFGHIQVTVQAMLSLLEHGCDIAMMTRSGHFRGRMVSSYTRNVPFRIRQYDKYTDPVFRLDISRRIITAKTLSSLAVLRAYRYSSRNRSHIDISRLKKRISSFDSACSLESLRGLEGAFARVYFKQFGQCIHAEGISFPGRQFFPSLDPVNALLSFGYSFVAREIQAALEASGFDPYIGFYHEIEYGRASLSLDILEEFRHCLVDRLTVLLLNKKMINTDNFYIDKKTGGCYLKKDSLNIFIHQYEQFVSKENVLYNPTGKRISFRKIFWEQVRRLKHSVERDETYIPFIYGKSSKVESRRSS